MLAAVDWSGAPLAGAFIGGFIVGAAAVTALTRIVTEHLCEPHDDPPVA